MSPEVEKQFILQVSSHLGDHAQKIGSYPAGAENPNLPPQTGQDPRAGAGILTTQAVTPLPEDSHLDIINNPTHWNTSI